MIAHEHQRKIEECFFLIKLIEYHPFVPHLWSRFEIAFSACDKNDFPESLSFPKFELQVREFCLNRSLVLLNSVEKTVKSFAKQSNVNLQKSVAERRRNIRLNMEEKDRIELYASMDIFQRELRNNPDTRDDEEFKDLGSSKLRKTIEDNDDMSTHDGAKEILENSKLFCFQNFEQNWFSFLFE